MRKFQIALAVFLISIPMLADVWDTPKTTRYFSQDSSYMVKVTPTQIPDKYWKWKSSKTKKRQKFSPRDTTIVLCQAILFKIEKNDTLKIWQKNLINPIMPVNVIVANDGKSLVTFDNWGSMGYGLEAMVIYDEKGGLVKRYQLEEISPIPINEFQLSISSIWWRCGVKYIDNQTIEICFQDKDQNIKTRFYNLITREFK
jgi:hypothetical protein